MRAEFVRARALSENISLATLWDRIKAARWLWISTALFIGTRAAIGFVAYASVILFAESPNIEPYHLRPDNILFDVFGSRWDTGFYLSIADEGYRYEGVDLPSVAFFPLMPLAMRAANVVTGDSLLSGLLVANGALWLASLFLYRLAADGWGEAVANRSVLYFLIFPTAFFGSAIYSESLFLLCATGALYFARKGYWESAALLAFGAGLSRFMGVIVAPMLFLEWWRQRQDRETGRAAIMGLLASAAAPLGTLAYMAYLQIGFGDALAFAHGAEVWARQPQSPLMLIEEVLRRPAQGWIPGLMAGQIHIDNWIDIGMVGLFLILGVVLIRRRQWSEGAFVLLGALVPLSSGLLMSQRRYVWVLFPAFILLARWGGRPWVDRLIVIGSTVGLTIFSALFANWYWVA